MWFARFSWPLVQKNLPVMMSSILNDAYTVNPTIVMTIIMIVFAFIYLKQSQKRKTNSQDQKKQGGYGKIPIHKDAWWVTLYNVQEILALFSFWIKKKKGTKEYVKNKDVDSDIAYCFIMLGKTSRR